MHDFTCQPNSTSSTRPTASQNTHSANHPWRPFRLPCSAPSTPSASTTTLLYDRSSDTYTTQYIYPPSDLLFPLLPGHPISDNPFEDIPSDSSAAAWDLDSTVADVQDHNSRLQSGPFQHGDGQDFLTSDTPAITVEGPDVDPHRDVDEVPDAQYPDYWNRDDDWFFQSFPTITSPQGPRMRRAYSDSALPPPSFQAESDYGTSALADEYSTRTLGRTTMPHVIPPPYSSPQSPNLLSPPFWQRRSNPGSDAESDTSSNRPDSRNSHSDLEPSSPISPQGHTQWQPDLSSLQLGPSDSSDHIPLLSSQGDAGATLRVIIPPVGEDPQAHFAPSPQSPYSPFPFLRQEWTRGSDASPARSENSNSPGDAEPPSLGWRRQPQLTPSPQLPYLYPEWRSSDASPVRSESSNDASPSRGRTQNASHRSRMSRRSSPYPSPQSTHVWDSLAAETNYAADGPSSPSTYDLDDDSRSDYSAAQSHLSDSSFGQPRYVPEVGTAAGTLASNARRTKSGKYPCHLCPKNFTSKHNLLYHIDSHFGKRPYGCNVCDKRFTARHTRDRHVKKCRGKDLPKGKSKRT